MIYTLRKIVLNDMHQHGTRHKEKSGLTHLVWTTEIRARPMRIWVLLPNDSIILVKFLQQISSIKRECRREGLVEVRMRREGWEMRVKNLRKVGIAY